VKIKGSFWFDIEEDCGFPEEFRPEWDQVEPLAIEAMTNYIKNMNDIGKVKGVKLIETTDCDEDDGFYCTAKLEGSEKDLRYLVYNNAGMDRGPNGEFTDPEGCQERWDDTVKIL